MLSLSACSKECKPIVITEIQEEKVPVRCKTKQVKCLETHNRTDAVTELIRCNYELQQANKECE